MENNEKSTLDLEAFAANNGLTVQGMNQDGSVKFLDQQGKERNLDINSYIKNTGKDPSKVNIQLNTPDTFKDENALGFTDMLKMTSASSDSQKVGLLQRQYGKDNVSYKDGAIKIKDPSDGMWKKAETSFASELVGTIPELAGGIAGGLAGSFLGPAGIIAGAGLGTTLAKYGENKLAEMLNIRTEQDLKTTTEELGKEFVQSVVFDTALFGAGKVLKAMAPGVKNAIADVSAALTTGTKASDWRLLLRSADDAADIMKIAKADAVHALSDIQDFAPSTKKVANILSESLTGAKNIAEKQYADGLQKLNAAGALEFSHAPISNTFNSLTSDLSEMGLVKKLDDGKWALKSYKELQSSMSDVVDEKAIKRISQVFNVVNSMAEKEFKGINGVPAKPELGELLKLKQFIGSVSQDLNHFANPSSASDPTKRLLSKTSKSVDEMFKSGASHITIDGQPGDILLNNLNSKYSNFKKAYEVFSDKVPDFSDKYKIMNVVKDMDAEKGQIFTNAYKDIAEATGNKQMLDNSLTFQRTMAGKNLGNVSVGKGITAALKGATRLNAANITPMVNAARVTKDQVKSALQPYTAIAKGMDFLKGLPQSNKDLLLQDVEVFNKYLSSMLGANNMKDEVQNQLMSQVPGGQ